MALHDYRKLIDDLHTVNGERFAITIEVVDPPQSHVNDGPTIRVDTLTAFGQGFDPVALTEHDAGLLYDALGGALREITTPSTGA